ncbi:protease inhibitor I42 family protein [Rhodoplanes azumiensis]|uniref:Protease inhibitor I42 family protein n=1 Tax=Rhodoplanes azumiensis TaxID=1897628 RepID=A0ABW5AQ70_9BRAD
MRVPFPRPMATATTLAVLLITLPGRPTPAPAQARTASAPLTLTVGESSTISLEENVTTGFAWRYDAAASRDAGCVTITDLGHARRSDAPAIGSFGLHRWKLVGADRGRAELRFLYQRPWEQKPVREHTIIVDVR